MINCSVRAVLSTPLPGPVGTMNSTPRSGFQSAAAAAPASRPMSAAINAHRQERKQSGTIMFAQLLSGDYTTALPRVTPVPLGVTAG